MWVWGVEVLDQKRRKHTQTLEATARELANRVNGLIWWWLRRFYLWILLVPSLGYTFWAGPHVYLVLCRGSRVGEWQSNETALVFYKYLPKMPHAGCLQWGWICLFVWNFITATCQSGFVWNRLCLMLTGAREMAATTFPQISLPSGFHYTVTVLDTCYFMA